MPNATTNIGLPFLQAGQAQKHVTVNESLLRLDALAQIVAASATTIAEPGSPGDGDIYILPAGKTGTHWGAMTNLALAYYRDGAWEEITPREGWLAWLKDSGKLVLYAGSAWATLNYLAGPRERLTADRTYFVRTDGADSHTGLANSAGGAFLTIQKAIDTVAALDLSIHNVTIQVGNGTYTGANTLRSLTGAGRVTIQGDDTTPANVVISTGSSTCFAATSVAGDWRVSGLQLTTSGGSANGISASGPNVTIAVGKLNFAAIGLAGILAANGAVITCDANYAISGSAAAHWYAIGAAAITNTTRTVSLSGAPAFSAAFVYASRLAYVQAHNVTFSGAATGVRYSIEVNAVAFSNGGGASFFPGDAAGSTATGGQYV